MDSTTPEGKKKARISASPETKTLNQCTSAADFVIENGGHAASNNTIVEIDSDAESDIATEVDVDHGGPVDKEKSAELDCSKESTHTGLSNLSETFIDELDDLPRASETECAKPPPPPMDELALEISIAETQRKLKELNVQHSTFQPDVGTETDTGDET